jgi:acyl-CoA synthetase (NDP forming)
MTVLEPEVVNRIDAILGAAHAEGRSALHEHEVYAVLEAVGLEVPRFLFVRDPSALDHQALRALGTPVVAKIVSPAVAHKQRVGGVKIVASVEPLYVEFVLSRMREEVLGHFPAGERPEVAGFLLVEHVPHTQALGHEVLVGIREDAAFGPVLTVSKGGDDAEFFARYYDAANLFLPPVEYEDALAFTRTLHIRHKFAQIGHPEYLALIARAMARFSALALTYSSGQGRRPFVLRTLEVNPFAISAAGRFVALDGLAEFGPAPEAEAPGSHADLRGMESFFQPRGVAVVGVSADTGKHSLARDIAQLLHQLRPDDLYLVNPRGGTLRLGDREYPLHRDLASVPAPVELAVYAAPAQAAPEFLRSLAGSAVRAVILIPGVPASIPYAEHARQLREATPAGIRLMGPNCMGVYCAADPTHPALDTLFIDEARLEVRSSSSANTALLTQSGALAVTTIDKLRNSRPLRAVASFGNKVDVKIGDLLAHFERDPSVQVLSVYLEGLDPGEGRGFLEVARQSRKPIVAYKGGRTEAGARSAASHTASMSGNYDVFRAACQQAGVILAETLDQYYDLTRTFALLASKPARGSRVAGVVNAGFESTVGADELRGLTQARLAAGTVARLGAVNRQGLVDVSSPFLDITPMADDAMYAQFLEAVIADEGVDCVFVAVVPHAASLKTVPSTCRDPDALASLLVGIARRSEKPLVVSVNAGRHYADFVAALEEGGLPVYTDIRSAITSLQTFVEWSLRGPPG